MQKKTTTRETTLTQSDVRDTLARPTPALAAEDEKVLRMRYGAPAPRTLVLERVGQDHPDAREKLLGIELELLRQWRERQAARPDPRAQTTVAPPVAARVAPAPNPRRDKIVQALRTKKSR
jgi:hypothetical protein